MWIIFTFFAAFLQALRNAFQKQLSQHVSNWGVTLARFLIAWPLALLYLLLFSLYSAQSGQALYPSDLNRAFFCYCLAAAVAQIFATNLMVQLFRLKNYAIGVGLSRSEAVIAAILGVLFFAAPLSIFGWLGVITGSYAVFLLSGGTWRNLSPRVLLTGLGSGLCFALTSLWVRQASLSLPAPALLAAAWTLFMVIFLQALGLGTYLYLRDRKTWHNLLSKPKLLIATSSSSCLASLCWFSAMSLQIVPLVKTLGQIEILFILLISRLFFKERLHKQDGLGLILVGIAAVLVLWA